MPDFPAVFAATVAAGLIHPGHPCVSTCNLCTMENTSMGANTWPAAQRAIYIPFCSDIPVIAKQMFWENGAVAGTTDIGIYDLFGNLLINSGAITNAGTIQPVDITDTPLKPGTYFMAAVASTNVTQTYISASVTLASLRASGVMQQAVGANTLPATATFAALGTAYLPFIGISFAAAM